MALPTKSQYEKILDTIAAQIKAAASGLKDASTTPDNGDLFTQIDAIGNPALEVYLLGTARDHDEALRDEDTLIRTLLGVRFGPLLARLQGQVSDDGTLTPATLDAALSSVGAQVSPYIQKVAPAATALGGALSPSNVFSPAIESKSFDVVYAGAEGALVNKTTDAADAGTSDVPVFASDNDVLYLGYDVKPTTADEHIAVALGTAGSADAGLLIQYWNGTAWTTLSTTDADTTGTYANAGSKGFTQSGVIKFAVPARWARTCKAPSGDLIESGDQTQRFYLRLARTADALVTPPVITQLRRGIGLGLVIVKADSSAQFVAGSTVQSTLYDAPNKLKLRALTNISANVTATITYTNRAGTAGRSQAQAAWSSIDAGDVHPSSSSSFLTLQTASEGVAAVTGVAITTTAVAGVFVIESVQERDETK